MRKQPGSISYGQGTTLEQLSTGDVTMTEASEQSNESGYFRSFYSSLMKPS